MKTAPTIYASACLLLSMVSLPFVTTGQSEMVSDKVIAEATLAPQDEELGPIEDMHKFMGFISKPAYRELKEVLTEEGLKRSAFRKIQQHSMVLGETTILVADRGPEDEGKDGGWYQSSLATYNAAKALYEAAGEKNEDEVRKQYGLMIDGCNKCHETYDENNHQLEK